VVVRNLLVAVHSVGTLSYKCCSHFGLVSPDEQETGDEKHEVEENVKTEVSRESLLVARCVRLLEDLRKRIYVSLKFSR
jgi:hypothetical protein